MIPKMVDLRMFSMEGAFQHSRIIVVLTKGSKVLTYNVPKANIPVSPILSLLLICSLRIRG